MRELICFWREGGRERRKVTESESRARGRSHFFVVIGLTYSLISQLDLFSDEGSGF
jgi:hypothetical protein